MKVFSEKKKASREDKGRKKSRPSQSPQSGSHKAHREPRMAESRTEIRPENRAGNRTDNVSNNQPHKMNSRDDESFLSAETSLSRIPSHIPELLAPAGDTQSFLAALAAGADAVYVGLKHFSARAGADNFSLTELSRMVNLAAEDGRKVYIAFNSLVKPGEMDSAGRLMVRLARDVKPHALIIQDPGLLDIARQAGFEGELHLSTLANLTHGKAMLEAKELGVTRVILPRELSIDEIRQAASEAPQDMDLEMFVHGALCYCVSGRCYWSSYLGGKSSLRGRCVQPCRRIYKQRSREGRYFSCQDLSIDILIRTLLDIPNLRCLKIEGRKKGPHYVYHAVAAYRMLLDAMKTGHVTTKVKHDAEALLEMALSRPRTRARFLPQKGKGVTTPDEPTSSGMLIGKIQFEHAGQASSAKQGNNAKSKEKGGRRQAFAAGKEGRNAEHQSRPAHELHPYFKPRQDLQPGDILRVGYEDEPWHETLRVTRRTPKAGTFQLKVPRHKTPRAGTPVFLIDRREPELVRIIQSWEKRLAKAKAVQTSEAQFEPILPEPMRGRKLPGITVHATLPQGKQTKGSRSGIAGQWMSPNTVRAVSRTVAPRISWWLPPVIWPDEEAAWQRAINEAIRNGSTHFVLGSPWQIAMFPKPEECREPLELIAGPFCNVANPATIALLARAGFTSAMISPELDKDDILALPRQSCLPLGMVIAGWWPVGISRHSLEHMKPNEVFYSPKGEGFWARNYGKNLWIYPLWPMDLTEHRGALENAGYAFFARLNENTPPTLPPAKRTSEFNWNGALL